MKTIIGSNPTLSAQTKLNGCLEKINLILILTPVSPLAQIQAQIVRPAQTPHISFAPSQVSVFIRTSSVMVILNAKRGKTRTCPIRSAMKII